MADSEQKQQNLNPPIDENRGALAEAGATESASEVVGPFDGMANLPQHQTEQQPYIPMYSPVDEASAPAPQPEENKWVDSVSPRPADEITHKSML